MKKIFKPALFVVFAVLTAVNVYKAQTDVQLSDVQLKNVEALATGESDIRRGYKMHDVSPTCRICKWSGKEDDYCDIYEQLSDCYRN